MPQRRLEAMIAHMDLCPQAKQGGFGPPESPGVACSTPTLQPPEALGPGGGILKFPSTAPLNVQ